MINPAAAPARKPSGERRHLSRSAGLIALLAMIMAAMVLCIACLAPPGRSLKVGDTAAADIKATFDIEDLEATEKARQQAVEQVEDIYYDDEDVFQRVQSDAESYLDMLAQMRTEAESLRSEIIQASERESTLRLLPEGSLTAEEWKQILQGEGMRTLRLTYGEGLEDEEIYALLALPSVQFNSYLHELSVRINSVLRKGVREDKLETIREAFVAEIAPRSPISINGICRKIAESLIQPTAFYDSAATERAISLAERSVDTVYIAKNEVVVEKGETISQFQFELLQKMGYAQPLSKVILRYVTIFLFFALVLALFMGYVMLYLKDILRAPGKCILTAVATILNLLLAFLMMRLDPALNTSFLGIMLIAQLVSPGMAFGVSLLIAPVVGIFAGGVGVFDYFVIAQTVVATAAGCLAGAYMARNATRRLSLMISGLAAGAAMSAVLLLFGVMRSMEPLQILRNIAFTLLASCGSAVLGIGMLPVWETVFDVATPARLMELSNASHPLLQQLMLEAPGTYHHSMMTASLAEAAASAVGANATLSRVGSYFHDIGKLKRPYYFKENQREGENPHDQLEPDISAAAIIAHVRDGVALAAKNKLPADVKNIIAQHHGNTLASVFYYKALEQSQDKDLSMAPFRYAGPRPQSKEAAIVLLADSVEAAVRSLKEQNADTVCEMVRKVVKGKVDDGQLGASPLTFADLEQIEKAFLKTFNGILHQRIEYPDINKLREELNDRDLQPAK